MEQRRGVTQFLSAFNDIHVKFADLETDLWIWLDKDGHIKRVWPGFTRALGYTEQDVAGIGITRLVDVNDLAIFIKNFSWYDTKERRPFRMYHKGGGEVWMRLITVGFARGEAHIILRQRDE